MSHQQSSGHNRHTSRKRSFAEAAALTIGWAIALIAIPELLLRAFGDPPDAPKPVVGNRHFVSWLTEQAVAGGNAEALYRPDRELIWRLEPGVRIVTTSQHFDRSVGESQPIEISINVDGYRGPQIDAAASPDTLRILCVGDSNLFGYPLGDDDAFPRVLARQLEAMGSRPVEVINAATPGYSIVQGWRWFETQFRDYPFDVLLLSFLNNDAWPQRQSDLDTLAAYASPWRPVVEAAEQLRLVGWVRARRAEPSDDSLEPRVDLEIFEERYRRFIDHALSRGARVILIDHRAYDDYATYTEVLRRLARTPGVSWLPVRQTLAAAFSPNDEHARYPQLAERVRRRWGDRKLENRPYLWYYAEFFPEHLNELGNRFIARLLGDEIAGRR